MKLIFNYKYQEKINELDQQLQIPLIHQQVLAINNIIATLSNRQTLASRPKMLGLLPDQAENFKLLSKMPKEVDEINELLNNFRSFISRQFGIWSLADLYTAQVLKEQYHLQSGLEIMAGNACWSQALSVLGIKMIASDSLSWAQGSETGAKAFYPTQKLDVKQAIKNYNNVDFIICCWAPNFGSSDLDALLAFRKYCRSTTKLFFIGEKDGATNTREFWKQASQDEDLALKKVNRSFTNFDFIKERFYKIK